MSLCPQGHRPSREMPRSPQTLLSPPAAALFPEDSAGPMSPQGEAHMPLCRSFLPRPLPYHHGFQTISLSSLENPTQVKLKTSITHLSCSAVTTPPHTVTEDFRTQLIWRDPDAGKDWGQEEKGTMEDEMVGWHHWVNGHEFGWTPVVGVGQGGLACWGSWGRKELDTTEWLNWTE